MDEVVHLKLSKEEYPTPAPKNIPEDIELVEKRDKKQSNDTMKTRFSVSILNILQVLVKLRNFLSLCYAN